MSEALEIARRLRAMSPARVGLGRSGVSQLTADVLSFQLSHAQARDAVRARFDAAALMTVLTASIGKSGAMKIVRLRSAAADRATYLQRPDLGRMLDEESRMALAEQAGEDVDIAIVVADGLSALAVERHAAPLLERVLPRLAGRSIGPICIVERGRVAIGDEIGEMLRARMSVILIGERPGLSSPDSLGVYVTWAPHVGRTDAERVCISNIRVEGLQYDQAAEQLERAVSEAFDRQLTGVAPAAQRRLGEV